MKRLSKLIFILISMQLLISCGVHKMNFECQGGQGVGCQSVSKVNDLVNKDLLKKEIAKHNEVKKEPGLLSSGCKNCKQVESQQVELQQGDTQQAIAQLGSMNSTSNAPVSRSKEKVIRIWFSGFFDKQNNYQDAQYVYAVIEPAKWVATQQVSLVAKAQLVVK
jgi:type IV conjugative transfer system lipoprotein TraV